MERVADALPYPGEETPAPGDPAACGSAFTAWGPVLPHPLLDLGALLSSSGMGPNEAAWSPSGPRECEPATVEPPTGPAAATQAAAPRAPPAGPWGVPLALAMAALTLALILTRFLAPFDVWSERLAGFAGLGRQEPETVAAHPQRARIIALLRDRPGLHLRELQRQLNLSRGVADHHLRKLLQAGLISERASHGYRCFFVRGTLDRRLMEAVPALRSDGASRILSAVVSRPGQGLEDLARSTSLTSQTVAYHVRRLQAAGLLTQTRGERAHRVDATELGRSAQRPTMPHPAPTSAAP
jgi:predicted transcriptional regulator